MVEDDKFFYKSSSMAVAHTCVAMNYKEMETSLWFYPMCMFYVCCKG